MAALYDLDSYEGLDELEEFDGYEDLDGYGDDFLDEWDEDEFLGRAWHWLRRPGTTQRRIALGAARAATGSLSDIGGAIGKSVGGELWGKTIGSALGRTLGGGLADLLPDQMDYLAELAAEADDEDEAEAFIGALIPLAARLLPHAGRAIMRVAPQLIRGASNVVRTVHGHPASRQLIRTMGTVVRRTGADIAKRVSQGRPVTGQTAVRSLARQTYRVMRSPQQLRRTQYRRNYQPRPRYRRCYY